MKNLNTQLGERADRTSGLRGIYDVHSIFSTIQGEGPFTGRPCVFIRLAGCNLQCPGCDTEYTKGRTRVSADDIIHDIKRIMPNNSKLVVITGGEPFRQELYPLCVKLDHEGFQVQIECNGTLGPVIEPSYFVHNVTIVCSPKTPHINKKLLPAIDHFKYVIDHNSVSDEDGLPVRVLGRNHKGHVCRPPANFKGNIYVQPADVKDEKENLKNIQVCVCVSMKFGYTVQIQTHKHLGVE